MATIVLFYFERKCKKKEKRFYLLDIHALQQLKCFTNMPGELLLDLKKKVESQITF